MHRMSSIVALAMIMALPCVGAADKEKRADVEAAAKLLDVYYSGSTSPEQEAVVNAITDFGLKLQNANSNSNENVTTSPFSLASALGLALNGAKGGTLSAISNALQFGGSSAKQFNAGYALLSQSLRNISKENVLSFGNAVFADVTFPVEESYLLNVQKSLGANAANVNFRKPAEAADLINGYIENQTRKMITKMVDASAVDGWRVALINAGYFKGAWDFKFDVDATFETASFNTGREIKKLPLMRQNEKTYLYYKGKGFQMATLAYKNGDFAMDLIVPDEAKNVGDALEQVKAQFTGKNYRQWIDGSKPTTIDLGLPRFEVEYKQDMSDFFKKAMPLAFSDGADFSLLSKEPVKLDKIIHATILKVNEEGTEGGFATVIGAVPESVAYPSNPQVIANRPFLFVIRHTASGTPIFVGTVWDPKPLPRPEK